jgi:sulfite reductase alpha subunit-like flavoprotein
MEEDDWTIVILYGSETGNSQDCAEMLAKKCQRLQFKAKVCAMDDYSVPDLTVESIVIVICSTTGQGELPRNALKFWRVLLRRKLPPTLLSHVKFTTFGLGDSSYPRFNWAIRKIHKRLLQLGAREFAPRGEGDEMNSEGYDSTFETWKDVVAQNLVQLRPLDDGVASIPDDELLEPRYQLDVRTFNPKRATDDHATLALSRPELCVGTIKSNDRITALDHFQDVRHFIFECEDNLPYVPGDTVALFPRNEPADVDELLAHQGWTEIADFALTVNEEFERAVAGGLVKPLTLRSLMTHHLDITAIPRRSFFALAWHFADNEREQERLREFSTLEGLQDLYDYANRPRRSILEAVTEFHSLKIPVEYILDLFPILRPRLFSIASPSPAGDGATEFGLAIAIVKYKTIIRRIRRGVCTRWVEQLNAGDRIPFSVFKTPFNIAANVDPMIMVAPGTGVAPMRSLILTRELCKGCNSPMALFFGCRFEDKDYIFRKDWKSLKSLRVVTAFSRQNGGYVQDKLYFEREYVADMIVNQGATLYVCGSAGKMPRQVRITIVTILQRTQNWELEKAEEYVQELERSGRYLQETW